jgi:hypothetical protein
MLLLFCLLCVVGAEFCAWNYRFDSVDNHFNIVYPDKNAVYFGLIVPQYSSNLTIYNDFNHPVATYFSVQIYCEDSSLIHYNDVELLRGDMDRQTPYYINISLDESLRYFALFRIYESQIDVSPKYWSASPPKTFINNQEYLLCDIDYSQQGNIYSIIENTNCTVDGEFLFMEDPPHTLMNEDANYMIACIQQNVHYSVHMKLPTVMHYPDFNDPYDIRYASISIVSRSVPRPTINTLSLKHSETVSIFVNETVPMPALLYRQILPNKHFKNSIKNARTKCGTNMKCTKAIMGQYYPVLHILP